MRSVTILGSTGSIGVQALEVVGSYPGEFKVAALGAGGSDLAALAAQVMAFDVPVVAIAADDAEAEFREILARAASAIDVPTPSVQVVTGPDAATRVAGMEGVDVVLNAITGAVGLRPTLAALDAGVTLALANKESLVVGGALVRAAKRREDQIVPVDSEHCAIAQALRGGEPSEVRRLVVTASGGPFRGRTREQLRGVTAQQAMAHPTWSMGPVITINSATLVNKGLEVIEAHLLFDVPMDRIDVVVHPQSMIHSMVEFVDGSTLAQASPPDMKLAIALGLSWPTRLPGVVRGCDWTTASTWTFEPVDSVTFPAIDLARVVGTRGGSAPAVYNAANEQCVDAFRNGRIEFLDIVDVIGAVVDEHLAVSLSKPTGSALTLDALEDAQTWARSRADALIGDLKA